MRLYTSALVAIVLSFLPEKSQCLRGPGPLRLRRLGDSSLERQNISRHAATQQFAEVQDKCDGSHSLGEQFIVVARHNEDLSWLIEHVETPFFAYQPENVSAPDVLLRTHGNGAYEASAYLQFIAEMYDCLPERTAFLHAHRSSWHSDDMVETLRQMNWSAVTGYMPVHKYYFQPYGTYVRLDGVSDPSRNLQTVLGSNVDAKTSNFTYGQIINATAYEEGEAYHYRQAGDVLFAWLNFFGPAGLGPVPEAIQYYCCAQFVVTKERIQRLPREFYLQAIDYANKGRWTGHFSPSYTRGLVFETLWHIIFGEPAMMPKAPSSELCHHFACDRLKR